MSDQNNNQDQMSQVPQISKSTRDQATLLAFIDQLISEKKDPAITPDRLPVVRQAMLDELNEQINMHLLSLLNESQQEEIDKLLERNAPDEELDAFFEKSIPELSTEIGAVLINFRSAFLTNIQARLPQTSMPQERQEQGSSEDLMAAPPAPGHTPFDSTQIEEDKAPQVNKTWN